MELWIAIVSTVEKFIYVKIKNRMNIRKLTPGDYELVRFLFAETYPNLPFIFSIIEGKMPGQVWVNDNKIPQVCLIITEFSCCYISGKLDRKIFLDFFNLIREHKNIKLVCEPSSHDGQVDLLQFALLPVTWVQFEYENSSIPVPFHSNTSEFSLIKITNKELFDKSIWKSLITAIYGNFSNYSKYGVSYILWDEENNQVVSEAHGIASKNLIEIGTITHEKYQGRKLSTIVCNHLIHASLKKGLSPIWACEYSNIASRSVARNQGMSKETVFTFHTISL